jgi:hypothetical protein
MGISTFPSAETNGVHHGKSEYVNGISTTEARPVDVPVLIVGGGPTGLLQAHLLSRLGGEPKVFIQPQSGISSIDFLSKIIARRAVSRTAWCTQSSCTITSITRDLSTIRPRRRSDSPTWDEKRGCLLGQLPHQSERKGRWAIAL